MTAEKVKFSVSHTVSYNLELIVKQMVEMYMKAVHVPLSSWNI